MTMVSIEVEELWISYRRRFSPIKRNTVLEKKLSDKILLFDFTSVLLRFYILYS